MFWTWLQIVQTVASSFLLPHHLSTRSLFFFFRRRLSSTLMWLKSLRRVPLGPFMITVHPFKAMSTFSGVSTVWLLRTVFILAEDAAESSQRVFTLVSLMAGGATDAEHLVTCLLAMLIASSSVKCLHKMFSSDPIGLLTVWLLIASFLFMFWK